MIKDLERRNFSWIIWVAPKCNHMYPSKGDAEMRGRLKEAQERRRQCGGRQKMEADIRTQAQEGWQPPEFGRSEDQILLYSRRGNVALPISVQPH